MQSQTTYDYYNRYGFTFSSETSRIEDFERYKDLLSELSSLSISTEGNVVCIETSSDLFQAKAKRTFGVDSPKEFYQELSGCTELEYLSTLVKFKNMVA